MQVGGKLVTIHLKGPGQHIEMTATILFGDLAAGDWEELLDWGEEDEVDDRLGRRRRKLVGKR